MDTVQQVAQPPDLAPAPAPAGATAPAPAPTPPPAPTEDVGALKRAFIREKQEAAELRAKVKAYEDAQAAEAAQVDQKKRLKEADVKKIEEYHLAERQKEKAASDERYNQLQQQLIKMERDKVIASLTDELSLPNTKHVVPLVVEKHIAVRADENGLPKTVVLDENGKETFFSVEDLTKQLRADKRYDSIFRGTDVGSGATKTEPAAPPLSDAKAQVPAVPGQSPLRLHELPPDELAARLKHKVEKTTAGILGG